MSRFRTYDLALQFYRHSEGLKLKGVLKDQFERAKLSIVLNLSEGSAKPSRKERKKFYHTSLGSLREVQSILEIIGEQALAKEVDVLAAHLYCLCKKC